MAKNKRVDPHNQVEIIAADDRPLAQLIRVSIHTTLLPREFPVELLLLRDLGTIERQAGISFLPS